MSIFLTTIGIHLFIGIIFYITVTLVEINYILDIEKGYRRKEMLLDYFKLQDLIIELLFWSTIIIIGIYYTYKEYKEAIKYGE